MADIKLQMSCCSRSLKIIYIKTAKNFHFILFSCCKSCNYWLCLSIDNFLIHSRHLPDICMTEHFCVYIFPHPDRFCHRFSLRKPMESEEEN